MTTQAPHKKDSVNPRLKRLKSLGRGMISGGARKTILAAFVGASVTIIVSPLAQTLSFVLNEYLSRPVLSIEYIELVPAERPVQIPQREVDAIVDSDDYRNLFLMKGRLTELMAYKGRTSGLKTSELKDLKDLVSRFARTIDDRNKEIEALIGIRQPTDDQVREAVAVYQGYMAPGVSTSQNPKTLWASLKTLLAVEQKALDRCRERADSLNAALSPLAAGDLAGLKLKISVLNRGATAGLIRNVGDLSSNGHSWQLSRCNAPKPAVDLSDLQMAVPVAVTNPSSDNERTSAVGKVEAHSMNELWFDVTAAANGDSVANLVSSYRADHLANATVVLHDHKAGTIEQKIQR